MKWWLSVLHTLYARFHLQLLALKTLLHIRAIATSMCARALAEWTEHCSISKRSDARLVQATCGLLVFFVYVVLTKMTARHRAEQGTERRSAAHSAAQRCTQHARRSAAQYITSQHSTSQHSTHKHSRAQELKEAQRTCTLVVQCAERC